MKKQWIYKNAPSEKIQELRSLGISPVLATLLVNRNVDLEQAKLFLNPDLSRLHNPFLLPDMEKAVLRLRQAIDRKEKILIYGDRDVDGVTALSILVRTLKGLGADVVWTIPTTEGYGLHRSILDKFKQEGVRIVITVDTGTSAVDEVAYANQIGLDVIITDHHLPPETLPPATAIVNPNLKSSTYPMKELAGCLTAFKFAYALMFSYNRTFNQEFVVLDFETTGLSSLEDEIVEVAAVCVRNFIPVGEFHSLVRPTKSIPKEAMAVHGITDEMVADAPPLAEILPRLMEFIGNRTIVAHNARFDLGFLQQASLKILGRQFENPSIDTLSLSRENMPSLRSHALTALARDLKIDLTHAHRAMNDCLATIALFQRIEEIRDPRLQFFLEDQMDLVTLGTIADIVPLIGENRIIVRHGLPKLLKSRKVGVKKLVEQCGVKDGGVPTAKEISWGVTPLLNAAGRFSKAQLAAQLMITDNEFEAAKLLQEIIDLNEERKNLQKANIEKFFRLAQQQCDLTQDRLIFVVAEGIEHGVTGIVASQMARQYQRPVVLLIVENGQAMGSSRSVPSFNIVEAFEKCKDLLVKYGGHPAAAGLTLETKNIEPLRVRLKKIAHESIVAEGMEPKIEIDMELHFDQLSNELLNELAQMEPFGEGNPAPVFSLKGVHLADHSFIGAQKNHLRLRLSNKVKTLSAIGWGMSSAVEEFSRGELVDVAFQIEIDRWNGNNALRLLLSDLCKSEPVN